MVSGKKNRILKSYKAKKKLRNNWELYLFVLPALIYIIFYCYYPMYGVQIAFKNYRVSEGITGGEWVRCFL